MKTELINGSRIACYDNGGKTADRYTVIYLEFTKNRARTFAARGMCPMPSHPFGIGQFTTAMRGSHLGKRIAFDALPIDCQKLVLSDLSGER